jgi:hypothetical protein
VLSTRRIVGQRLATNLKFAEVTGGGYRRSDLQGALADRVVFSGLETVAASENVCRDLLPQFHFRFVVCNLHEPRAES